MANHIVLFNKKANEFVEHLKQLAQSNTFFSFREHLNNLILEIIAQAAFGWHVKCTNDMNNKFRKSVQIVLSGLYKYHTDRFIFVSFVSCSGNQIYWYQGVIDFVNSCSRILFYKVS